MLNFLSKNKLSLVCAVFCVCLVFLLCPLQAQAAGNLEVTLESPTNPDHIFTGDEVYDLTVYLASQDAGSATYYISHRIVDSRKLVLIEYKDPTPVTLSKDGRGELMLDLSSIKGSDTFRVEIKVTDESGDTIATAYRNFGRVSKKSLASVVGNTRNGAHFSTDTTNPKRYLYLKKEGLIAETLTVTYYITDADGHILRQVNCKVDVPAKDYFALPIHLYGLEIYSQCRLSYAVYDDTNNIRATGCAYFNHIGTDYFEGTLRSASEKTGLIFANDEPFDLTLELKKTDSIPEVFSMRYTVTDTFGNTVSEFGDELSLPEAGAVQVPLKLPEVTNYGIFTLTVTATDKYGNEKTLQFSFSRVLATAQPGAVPVVNINDHFTSYNGDANKKLELSAQAGFGMWRCGIPWMSVERKIGSYSMPVSVEEIVQKSEALGMEPLIVLAYGNDELYGLPDPTNPGWLEGYANYCKYIASYFGDRVTYYEIWNEWNHATMGKTDPKRHGGNYYAMALAAASKAIRSVNPNAKIIGGAMAGHGEAWMTAMLDYDGNRDGKSDAMVAMDGFSYHAYNTDFKTCFYSPWEKGFLNSADEVIAVLNRYGDASTKEIWVTESGWSTVIGPGVTEEVQAAYFVQVYTWTLANSDKVDRYFWYDFMNDRDFHELDWDPTNAEHNWGLIHSWTNTGNEPLPYSAKKSYLAASAFNSMMAGAQYVGTYDLGEDIYGFRFQKDGQDLLVAFMDGESKTVDATFDGDLVVTDMYGNATTHTGSAQLNLSTCPIYIQCDLNSLIRN